MMLFGIKIFTSDVVGEAYQDWSGVRSPSRAVRRLKRGFPQNIVTRYRANGTFVHDKKNQIVYCHPADAIQLEKALKGTPS